MASNPRVFILPSSDNGDSSNEHTILTFKHPNTNVPTRYLVHHPKTSSPSTSSSTPFIYEILKVANSPYAPRSWLIAPDTPPLSPPTPKTEDEETTDKEAPPKEQEQENQSLIIRDAHLYLTTPFDPLYLLLPHLSSQKTSRNFLTLDDLLESHPESTKWSTLQSIHPDSSKILQSRLLSICDTVSTGGDDDDDDSDQMFRLNQEKLYTLLISRVESVAKALPSSLTKHISKKLLKPIGTQASIAWKRQSDIKPSGGGDGVINDAEIEDQDEDTAQEVPVQEGADSQLRREASKLNLEDTADMPMEEAINIVEEDLLPPPEIQYICQLSHSLQFFQNYLPQGIYTSLSERLNKIHPQEPLEKYMEELKSLRAAASAALDFSMSHSKRTLEDLEAGGGKTKEDVEREKKRKKKEEDAKTSSGVKKLAKVDTSGMMKMTSFFKKKDPKT
ncbi:hypothetical protein TWF718_011076 [Orbilia javanica]|uniref:Ribonuclease H2 subunit B n=1 Tax=Orbilia javanica TaxID=47235 RepID=A0AAN8R9E2_9PEZI